MSDNTFTNVEHPSDPTFQLKRQKMIYELLTMNANQLNSQLKYQSAQKPPADASGEMTKRVISDLYNAPFVPQSVKSLLDTTSGTSGNVLIRQDLEPTLYA